MTDRIDVLARMGAECAMREDRSARVHLPAAIVVAVLAIYAAIYATESSDCSAHGGVLVRGVFWFECVEKR
jgi:drug/metabolite transporter superfamily protein YnfA